MLNSLGDHQYVSKKDFQTNILGIPEGKKERILQAVNEKLCFKNPSSTVQSNVTDTSSIQSNITDTSTVQPNDIDENILTINKIVTQNEIPVVKVSDETVYDNVDKSIPEIYQIIKSQTSRNENPIKLDLCFLDAPDPSGNNCFCITKHR